VASKGLAALAPNGLLDRTTRSTNNRPAWSRTPGSNIDKVDSRLTGALERAAEKFARDNPGYTVEGFSGKKGRTSGTKNHPAGRAIDVNIIGPDGKRLGNVRNAATFRTYEALAQEVRKELDAVGLTDVGRWGGYFQQGVAFDQMHFDLGPRDSMAYGTWEGGLNSAGLSALPGAQSVGMDSPRPPNEMQAPQTLAQTMAREQALASAFGSPTRALDVPQSALAFNAPARPATPSPLAAINKMSPPSRFAPVPAGNITRTSLPSIPASLTPAPVGKVERAPLGPVGQFSQPASSLQHPTSVAKPTNLAAAPVGKVTKGPALAPATPNASTLAAQYGQYRPSTATSMPTVATPPSVPVGALPAAKPSTATLAAQYAQYRPGTVPPAPVAPVTPPALALPPAQVLAPLLAPPKVVKDYPVAEVQQAPAPPRATAYDVYSGMADTALDNTGLNTVSSMPGGGTSVTNQYGATTGMKNGYQTAVGSLPGITGPTASKFGSAVKGAIPGVAGSALGGLLGGPVGALLGAALAKAVTQPGGLLSGQTSFQTDYFGTLNAAKAKGGLGFPGAPSGGYGTGGKMGASFSNNSANGMRGISPAAADAIGKGQGGLY
jgi:hypothetical protein